MESLELRIFQEVAYTKSFTKTAENMGYVQSNITADIKKLEYELNTILFNRNNKGVTLTQDGEKLLLLSEKILFLLDEATQAFKSCSKSLNIGTTQTISGYLLPQCLAINQNEFPNVSISVHSIKQTEFDTKLANGQLDCIITNNSREIAQAKQIFQYPEELLLIVPITCNTLDEVDRYPIIANNLKSCPYRRTLLNWWNINYTPTPNIIELDTVEAILNMVANNSGISLLPKHATCGRQDIKTFYVEELQSTSIHMWIAKNKQLLEYTVLRNILKEQLKR